MNILICEDLRNLDNIQFLLIIKQFQKCHISTPKPLSLKDNLLVLLLVEDLPKECFEGHFFPFLRS